MIKNTLRVLFALVVAITVATTFIPSDYVSGDGGTFSVSNANGTASGNVDIDFKLNATVESFWFDVTYSPGLTPIAITDKTTAGFFINTDLDKITDDTIKTTWINSTSVDFSGTVFTITFKIASGATGTKNIEMTCMEMNGIDSEKKAYGTVTIGGSAATAPGTEKPGSEEVKKDTATLTVKSANIAAGKTETVDFYLESNPGLSGFQVKVTYDPEILDALSVGNGTIAASGLYNDIGKPLEKAGEINITWLNEKDVTDDGTLFTVMFKALDSAAEDSKSNISVTSTEFTNQNEDVINVTQTAGTVTIPSANIDGDPDSENRTSGIVWVIPLAFVLIAALMIGLRTRTKM